MNLLDVDGLGGGFGRLSIFRNACFGLVAGEVLGLLGPNGAGKTTLMKTLAGLLAAQQGSIRLAGRAIDRLRADQRTRAGLVLVPEGRQIFTGLSVADNLGIARSAGRYRTADFVARRDELLALFPRLAERLLLPGGALSGGEQQMLAICRALLCNPVVLLLDEPTQGLAPIMVAELQAALRRLAGRLPMLIVEQNRGFLDGLADRVMTMRAGRIDHET